MEPASIDDLPAPGGSSSSSTAGRAGAPRPDGTGWRLDAMRADGLFLLQADYEGAIDVVRVRSAILWAPDGAMHRIGQPRLPTPGDALPPRLSDALVPAWDGAAHAARVDALRARIAAGDCYQVNLTLPFTGTLAAGDDLDVALALLACSPAPFAAFIRRPGRPSVVSHSPECFVATAGADIVSCPIKGTRRADDPEDLLAAEKDRAELAMIVDLVRNDLGRLAQTGSVRVAEPARLLHLPYVRHLVADVAARLRPDATWRGIFAAAFPAGSITGAPKAMAMELIRRTEAGPRGAYCGAFGWIGAEAAQLAVAIRTLAVDGARATLHAGSGIVADSDGAAEWDEVRAKASAMAAALGGSV